MLRGCAVRQSGRISEQSVSRANYIFLQKVQRKRKADALEYTVLELNGVSLYRRHL